MALVEEVKSLILSKLEGSDAFLVDLSVSTSNKIQIEVDTPQGISIQRCVEISRFLEGELLEQGEDDFELQVSSPGLDKPYRVYEQYEKNVGRTVLVKTKEGKKINGLLKATDQSGIVVEVKEKKPIEGKKKKQWVTEAITLPFDEIEETKTVISFK